MLNITDDQIRTIGTVLNDDKRPLKERFRALFTLRNIGGPTAIDCIKPCFRDSSALLKHELAYCLGQMQDSQANSILIDVLKDPDQEPMVRHEAAEALGAIGSSENLEILQRYVNDPVVEVAETCQLALERIKWLNRGDKSGELPKNPYNSIDPAPASIDENLANLQRILLDDNRQLFERYRAMFTLRNLNSPESVKILSDGLKCGSALFRHEIAFVLGQMQNSGSIGALIETLEDVDENEMVRHECAEALGAIATQDCYEVLQKYLNDDKRVVKESCEIALDLCEYENSPEFQYANTLQINS